MNSIEQLEDEQYERDHQHYIDTVVKPIVDKLDIHVGDIYEHCSYHPVRCTEIDIDNDDISGISLVNGVGPMSCSFVHCGVRKLTEQEAQQIVDLWNTGGERAVLIHRGWTEEAVDKFIKEWR